MEEAATCNDDSNIAAVTHSSPMMLFDGKRLVMDEMDFFAENKKKNVVGDDEMVHKMELHLDVGKLIIFFFFICLYYIKYIDKNLMFVICCNLQTSLDLLIKSSPTNRSTMREGSSEARGNKGDNKVLSF